MRREAVAEPGPEVLLRPRPQEPRGEGWQPLGAVGEALGGDRNTPGESRYPNGVEQPGPTPGLAWA